MSTPVEKITNLIQYLPYKDIKIAEKFLKTRQFENLKEIVDSDIYKVIKDRKKEESIQKYIHIDLDALYSLQSELSAYLLLLGINNEEDYDNDYLMGEE